MTFAPAIQLLALSLATIPISSLRAAPGDAIIRAQAGAWEIVITTTARVAGAIHSLTWNGKEFINSSDHGRQLQSASNLDNGTPITNETYNPTEAGSVRDGAGATSTSQLISMESGPNWLQSTNRMAFWLAPGDSSSGNRAKNTTQLSQHLLTKRVTIGYKSLPQVISYDVSFSVPTGESHQHAVFEALTGYMPATFSTYSQFNPRSRQLEPLGVGPGEIGRPVVLSLPSGSHAMGIYAPPQPGPGLSGPTYGRFSFDHANVSKWNCVFRLQIPTGIRPAKYPFKMFVAVGTLDDVTQALGALDSEFAAH